MSHTLRLPSAPPRVQESMHQPRPSRTTTDTIKPQCIIFVSQAWCRNCLSVQLQVTPTNSELDRHGMGGMFFFHINNDNSLRLYIYGRSMQEWS